ncbi:hypothetical protein HPB47_022872, partial [Ixodes persulcatus]
MLQAEFQLKLSRRLYLEAKILREAWTEICLPDYKMEGASSEEQEEEFRQEEYSFWSNASQRLLRCLSSPIHIWHHAAGRVSAKAFPETLPGGQDSEGSLDRDLPPDYKMEGASSEEQEEEFRQEFRRLRDAVLLTEQPLPGLAPPPSRPPSDNLQVTIHDLLSKQLDRVSTALSECGGKSKSDNQPVVDKVESTCMNVTMLQDKLHELRLQCSKRIVELTRIFHDGVERAVSTPELGESARQLLRDWRELKNLDLQL